MAEIERVVSRFPCHRRAAVEAFLLRAVFRRRFSWIGARLGLREMQAWRAHNEGREYLNELIRRGTLTREKTLELIRDLIPQYA